MNTVVRILRMAARYRFRLGLGVVCTVIAANFQLLIPQFLGAAVDHAQSLLAGTGASPAEAQAALQWAAVMLLTAGVLRGLFTMIHNYQGEAIGQSIGYELRLAYFEKLQRMSFAYHDRVHSGDLMTRGMLDVEGIRRFVDGAMLRTIVLVILVGYGGYHLIGIDPVLGALALSFVPVVAWRAAVSSITLRRTWRALQERMSILTRIMEENLGGIRVVRAFAARAFEMAKFDTASDSAIVLAMRRIQIRYTNAAFMTFSYYAAMGLVLWVGSHKIIEGAITVGTLAEFLAFMAILQQPVRQVGMIVNSTARAFVSGGRVFELLDMDPAVQDKPGAAPLRLTDGVIRFEHVDFAYGEGEGASPALHDVNFEVGPGKSLGIVGPPGSGKSTIAHLIPRFYDPTLGRITIDGQDIRDVTLDSLREAVGVVQQDTFLFTATVDSNVAYGDLSADRERIVNATDSAQLHEYIDSLPTGYDTLVGERGLTLSGGQRQRLSIARSILLTPAIIVFDDSTASIDAATEQRIHAALKELTRARATIIISHRLSSFMHADEILFIDQGRIVERGSHEELLALGGRYKELYDLQADFGDDLGLAASAAAPEGA
ncbi:MAG: ABC transporter ATP-binding protein [Alphaproteobacteria bacterium]|nr:ABC transporter ATP-binding protein [Pseudomonadota bacterium]TDI66903.1 MAG: ABC transporter ATP-binding protein [Alphaproteobacteria bacterium]